MIYNASEKEWLKVFQIFRHKTIDINKILELPFKLFEKKKQILWNEFKKLKKIRISSKRIINGL